MRGHASCTNLKSTNGQQMVVNCWNSYIITQMLVHLVSTCRPQWYVPKLCIITVVKFHLVAMVTDFPSSRIHFFHLVSSSWEVLQSWIFRLSRGLLLCGLQLWLKFTWLSRLQHFPIKGIQFFIKCYHQTRFHISRWSKGVLPMFIKTLAF